MVKKTKFSHNEMASQSILLEEYRSLHNDLLRLRSEGVTRVNFFITSASVALGGVFVLGSSNNIPFIYFRVILILTLSLLSVIGLEIYNYLLQRDIGSDRHIRGLARIRNYFVEIDPTIEEYFINNIHDAPTGYITRNSSGMRRTTQIIEGIFVGSSLTVLSTFLTATPSVIIGIGISITILTVLFLEIKAYRRLRKAYGNAEKEMKFNNDVVAK